MVRHRCSRCVDVQMARNWSVAGFFSARRPTIVHHADCVIGSLNERSQHHRGNLRSTVCRSPEHVAPYRTLESEGPAINPDLDGVYNGYHQSVIVKKNKNSGLCTTFDS